jgi:hypothetical protein
MFDLATIRRMNEGAPGRLSNAEIMEGADILPGSKPVRVAHNSMRFVDALGNVTYRHRRTDVVTILADGKRILRSGGWETVTTKERINRFANCRLYQRRHVWYIDARDGKPVEFADGMTIDADGFPCE